MESSNWVFEMLKQMGPGCLITLKLFVITIVLSIPLGLIVTFLYMSKNKPLSKAIGGFILLMRGTPLLLQMFFVWFALPMIPYVGEYLELKDRFVAGAVAFVLNYAAYFAEIFRGGILAIDKGQYEASKVLGISELNTKIRIVLPQMFRTVLPSVANETIILLKDTALISSLGVADLLNETNKIVNRTTNITAYVLAAILYLVLSYVLSVVFKKLEKKFSF